MAYQVIARKYRPQRFADVVGQEHITRTLANTIGYRLEEVFPTIILDQMDITKRICQVIEKNQPTKGERMTYRAPGCLSASITIASCHSLGRAGWKGLSSSWTM